MNAPDYAGPLVGWRSWHVVEKEGSLRLRSPLYLATWPPRRELVATCWPRTQAALALYWERRLAHEPPDERCGCGIYAARTAAQAVAYMSRLFKPHGPILHRVVGTVSLWGTVVECDHGWRASHAYPAHIYVPVPVGRRLSLLPGRLRRPRLPAEEIALQLADYGIPVELVEFWTLQELADTLDATAAVPLAA